MFGSNGKAECLKDFRPTSKAQLRQFCMWFADGDVKKAREMYDYYSDGIELPDVEPEPPTKMQRLKDNAADIMAFVRDNQGDIATAIGFVRSFFGKATPQTIIEPITKIN